MPKERIPPSGRISKEIMELIEGLKGGGSNQEVLGELIKLSIKKLLQEILGTEAEEYIGKSYYERGKDRAGYRNGYKPAHIKTGEGKIRIDKPQVSDSCKHQISNMGTYQR
jgi:transposase-like protein